MIDGAELLDALEGCAWVVDAGGVVIDYGRTNWNAFAIGNDAGQWARPNSCIGLAFTDIIQGEEVVAQYRDFLNLLRNGKVRQVVFAYRCDGPGVGREMRMTITAVGTDKFLFQTTVLHAYMRPPVPLYDFRRLLAAKAVRPDLPILAMCSFCQRVRLPAGDDPGPQMWISGEEYYARGGGSAVSISHTVCPDCQRATLLPK